MKDPWGWAGKARGYAPYPRSYDCLDKDKDKGSMISVPPKGPGMCYDKELSPLKSYIM